MSKHRCCISWNRESPTFDYDSYNREHRWHTGSGQSLSASAAPEFGGTGSAVDPEEAFVASVASCHMLSFLAICARRRMVVDGYEDQAAGWLEKNADGRLAITRVELRPRVTFAGEPPDADRLAWLHERAHHECFIANSVRTEIVVISEE